MGHFTNGVGIKTTIIYPRYLVSQNAPQGGGKYLWNSSDSENPASDAGKVSGLS